MEVLVGETCCPVIASAVRSDICDTYMITIQEAAQSLYYQTLGLQRRRAINRIARKRRPEISRFFRMQEKLVLAALKERSHLFSESFQKLTENSTQFTLTNWLLAWDEIEAGTNAELHSTLAKVEADGLIKGASTTIADVGTANIAFDLSNPRAVAWFSEHAGSVKYIKGIQTTTQNQIKTILTHSIDTGQSYNKTAKIISEKFTGFSRQRAQTIAVHESAQAFESGGYLAEQQMIDAGLVLEKAWRDSGDELVTPECQENSDAGWLPFDGVFPSGHLHPPRFPGCRCWHITRRVPK